MKGCCPAPHSCGISTISSVVISSDHFLVKPDLRVQRHAGFSMVTAHLFLSSALLWSHFLCILSSDKWWGKTATVTATLPLCPASPTGYKGDKYPLNGVSSSSGVPGLAGAVMPFWQEYGQREQITCCSVKVLLPQWCWHQPTWMQTDILMILTPPLMWTLMLTNGMTECSEERARDAAARWTVHEALHPPIIPHTPYIAYPNQFVFTEVKALIALIDSPMSPIGPGHTCVASFLTKTLQEYLPQHGDNIERQN